MADSVGSGFPSTGINKGHTFYDIDEGSTWVYIGGIPRLVSSWKLINGIFNAQPDTTLWGLNQAGAQWFLTGDNGYYGWDGSSIVLVSSGSSNSNLYDYKTSFKLQDDFGTGTATDGNVGDLGWLLPFATASSVRPSDNVPIIRPGIFRLGTTAVSGTPAYICLSTDLLVNSTALNTVIWVIRLNTNDGNVTVRNGLQNASAGNPPLDGIFFEKLDADVNWFCVTRNSGVQTRTNSGISIDTLFHTFSWVRTISGVIFSIDNNVVATNTTNIPTISLVPEAYIINSAAANKTMDIDYFQMTMTGLLR